jgi:hypothetical protein
MKKWVNFVILIVSCFLVVLSAEVFIRLFKSEIKWAQRKDPVLGWSNDEYKQFDPHVPKGDESEKRILFLGDSFIAGSSRSRYLPQAVGVQISNFLLLYIKVKFGILI